MKAETRKFRLARHWHGGKWVYATHAPRDGGRDWGYADSPHEAAAFSEYWAGRFRADCRAIGQPFTVAEIVS